jgi:hypothetical protein
MGACREIHNNPVARFPGVARKDAIEIELRLAGFIFHPGKMYEANYKEHDPAR